MPQAQPELKKVSCACYFAIETENVAQYMEKRLFVQLNGNRKVIGILRGYDVLEITRRFHETWLIMCKRSFSMSSSTKPLRRKPEERRSV